MLSGHHDVKDHKNWSTEVLDTLDAGLKAFGPVSPRRVKPTGPLPHRGVGAGPDGAVTLAVYTRYLHQGKRDGPAVIDSLTLPAGQWRAFLPAEATAGTEWALPEAVARQLCRGLSPSSDQSTMPRPREVTSVRLTGQVVEVKDGIARVRYRGEIAARHTSEGKTSHGQAQVIGPDALALACDVTSAASVDAAFARIAEAFGGVDIVVSNAGAAWQGRIGEVDEAVLRKSFELNFWGHQRVAQAAVRLMLAQGTGGCLLFNVSKQAVNPGPNFGPYGLPKAATLALMRQYAIDYGRAGVRANAVNADRIRTGLLTDAMIRTRSAARGLSEHDYMAGNLLGEEVTAEDVAQAAAA